MFFAVAVVAVAVAVVAVVAVAVSPTTKHFINLLSSSNIEVKGKMGINYLKLLPQKLPYVFSDEHIKRVIQTIKNYHHEQKGGLSKRLRKYYIERDILILLFGLCCGLREREVAELRTTSIEFNSGTLYVNTRTKMSNPRIIPIPPILLQKVREFINNWSNKYNYLNFNTYLFPTRLREHISKETIRCNFRNYFKIAGIYEYYGTSVNGRPLSKYHFHTLRHTFATRMLQATGNLELVRKLLGHKCIASTIIYTHLTYENMDDAIKAHEQKFIVPLYNSTI